MARTMGSSKSATAPFHSESVQRVHARIKGGLSDCEEPVRRKILWENSLLYKVTGPSAADEAKLA
jgi:hypothetical protein